MPLPLSDSLSRRAWTSRAASLSEAPWWLPTRAGGLWGPGEVVRPQAASPPPQEETPTPCAGQRSSWRGWALRFL